MGKKRLRDLPLLRISMNTYLKAFSIRSVIGQRDSIVINHIRYKRSKKKVLKRRLNVPIQGTLKLKEGPNQGLQVQWI